MAATLAIELLDEILNNLHPEPGKDKASLRACTLVARSWTAVAQDHLFRYVYLDIRHPSFEQCFEELGLGRAELPTSPLRTVKLTQNAFVDFLKEHPHLGVSIRHLNLHQSIPRTQPGRYVIDADLFAALLHSAPNIQELFLSDVTLSFTGLFAYPINRPSLSHMELSYPSVNPSSDEMVCLLRLFKEIRRLTWRHCGLANIEYIQMPFLPQPPVVKEIRVEGIDVWVAKLDVLPANMIDFGHLEHLELVPGGPFYRLYHDILERSASTIRHLRMFVTDHYEEEYATLAGLAPCVLQCTRMEELFLEMNFTLPDVSDPLGTVLRFLSAARITATQFPALRRLVLVIHYDETGFPELAPFPELQPRDLVDDLDKILVKIVLQSHVAKVECQWHEPYNPHDSADLKAYQQNMFPRLVEQKALEFAHFYEEDSDSK